MVDDNEESLLPRDGDSRQKRDLIRYEVKDKTGQKKSQLLFYNSYNDGYFQGIVTGNHEIPTHYKRLFYRIKYLIESHNAYYLHISQVELGKRLSMTINQVKKAIRMLKDSQYLLSKRGKGRVNLYCLNYDYFIEAMNDKRTFKELQGNFKSTVSTCCDSKKPALSYSSYNSFKTKKSTTTHKEYIEKEQALCQVGKNVVFFDKREDVMIDKEIFESKGYKETVEMVKELGIGKPVFKEILEASDIINVRRAVGWVYHEYHKLGKTIGNAKALIQTAIINGYQSETMAEKDMQEIRDKRKAMEALKKRAEQKRYIEAGRKVWDAMSNQEKDDNIAMERAKDNTESKHDYMLIEEICEGLGVMELCIDHKEIAELRQLVDEAEHSLDIEPGTEGHVGFDMLSPSEQKKYFRRAKWQINKPNATREQIMSYAESIYLREKNKKSA